MITSDNYTGKHVDEYILKPQLVYKDGTNVMGKYIQVYKWTCHLIYVFAQLDAAKY